MHIHNYINNNLKWTKNDTWAISFYLHNIVFYEAQTRDINDLFSHIHQLEVIT